MSRRIKCSITVVGIAARIGKPHGETPVLHVRGKPGGASRASNTTVVVGQLRLVERLDQKVQ